MGSQEAEEDEDEEERLGIEDKKLKNTAKESEG